MWCSLVYYKGRARTMERGDREKKLGERLCEVPMVSHPL